MNAARAEMVEVMGEPLTNEEPSELAHQNVNEGAAIRTTLNCEPVVQSQPRRAPRLVAVGAHDLLRAEFPDRETLLEPWLQSQALAMIYAWRGVGKTHMAMLIAYALASGGRCLQWSARTIRLLGHRTPRRFVRHGIR